ncbi:MAG: hypothetical protein HQ472_06465 [Ignavibacteria bacterium]|nr:hypothetical protein [Ignavibacteria bacterium]
MYVLKFGLSLIITLLISACSGSTDPVPNGLRATIDGVDWAASGTIKVGMSEDVLAMYGVGDNITMQLTMQGIAGVGTYQFGVGLPNNSVALISVGPTSGSPFLAHKGAGTGTMQITTLNSAEVIGTFTLELANTINIKKIVTNGQFNLKF